MLPSTEVTILKPGILVERQVPQPLLQQTMVGEIFDCSRPETFVNSSQRGMARLRVGTHEDQNWTTINFTIFPSSPWHPRGVKLKPLGHSLHLGEYPGEPLKTSFGGLVSVRYLGYPFRDTIVPAIQKQEEHYDAQGSFYIGRDQYGNSLHALAIGPVMPKVMVYGIDRKIDRSFVNSGKYPHFPSKLMFFSYLRCSSAPEGDFGCTVGVSLAILPHADKVLRVQIGDLERWVNGESLNRRIQKIARLQLVFQALADMSPAFWNESKGAPTSMVDELSKYVGGYYQNIKQTLSRLSDKYGFPSLPKGMKEYIAHANVEPEAERIMAVLIGSYTGG